MTVSRQQWFQKWFNEDYLKLYQNRDNNDAKKQIQLVLKTIKPKIKDSILDLACGEGRHLAIMTKLGFKVFGLDLSEELIDSGKKKHGKKNFIIGDIRNIPGKFDIILSFFSSFGYFESDEENLSVFNSIFQALNPNGKFWFDFLNPEYVKNNITRINIKKITDEITITEERKIEKKRVIKKISFTSKEEEKT